MGPCSLRGGSREEYASHWELVCNIHRECYPDHHQKFNKDGEPVVHIWVHYREWLSQRGKLRTGKTV